MIRRPLWLVPAALAGLAVTLAAAQTPTRPAAQDPARPGAAPPDGARDAGRAPPGPPPSGELLQQAYEQIGLVALCLRSDAVRLSREDAALLDPIKDLYRTADKARRAGDERRASAYAGATLAAVGGLMQEVGVAVPAVEGLPAPPIPEDPGRDSTAPARPVDPRDAAPGRPVDPRDAGRAAPAAGRAAPSPSETAREFLREIRDRLDSQARAGGSREAKPFVDAGRRAAEQAQRALQDRDYRKVFGLAYAAEAWSQVDEAIRQADAPARPRGANDRGELPAPRPRAGNAPPPPRP